MPHARLRRWRAGRRERRRGSWPSTPRTTSIAPQPPSGNVEGASGTLEGAFGREVLARDMVRFVGEPFAVVIAESLAHGEDAAELVWPEFEPLEAVTDVEAAAADGAPSCSRPAGRTSRHAFEPVGTTTCSPAPTSWSGTRRAPAARARADGDERDRRGPRGGRRVHGVVSTQVPFDVRTTSRSCSGWTRSGSARRARRRWRLRREAAGLPGVRGRGGGRERCGRPVRWAETRSESMLSLTHGRAQVQHVEIGARRDGTIVGMRVELLADMGAYPIAAFLPITTQEMLVGRVRDPADRVAWLERRHEHDAGRAVPGRRPPGGDGTRRARDGPDRGRARDRSRRRPSQEPDPGRRVPVHDRVRHHVRHRGLRASARRGAADRGRSGAPCGAGGSPRARRSSAARHRGVHVRRDHGVRVEGVRVGRGPRGRPRDGAHRRVAAGAGARDGVRADRVRRSSACRSTRCAWCTPTARSCRAGRARGARARCRSADRRSSSRAQAVVAKARALAVAPARGRRGRPHGAGRRAVRGGGRAGAGDHVGGAGRRPRTTRRGCRRA